MRSVALSKYLSWTAAGISVASYCIYHVGIFGGTVRPNIVAWGLWAFITVLNFTTYTKMSGDYVKSLLSVVNSTMCIVTFLFTLGIGTARMPGIWDLVVLGIGVASAVVWYIRRDAANAQLLVQLAIAIGFIPNLMSVWTVPGSEAAFCWFMWTVSFAIQGIVVYIRWTGKWQEAAYPVNCTVLHCAVGLLALRA